MHDLNTLIASVDADAPLAQRHLWLISLCEWIRGDRSSVEASAHRVQLFLAAAESQPAFQARLQLWWRQLAQTVDVTALLADFGFAPRTAFTSA